MKHDYVPSRDAEFDRWLDNLVDYVKQRTLGGSPMWTHIPPSAVEELDDARNDWKERYELTLHPHTPAQTVGKNDARKRTEKIVRPFVQSFLYWKAVSDEDRTNMELPNRDMEPTPQHAPSKIPEIETDTSVIRRLRFRMRDFGSKSWAKPEHVHGMDFRWAALAERPSHVDELKNIVNATANPIVLDFDEADRGKRVYFAVRWVNNTGHGGPWSDIESAIIP